MLKKKLLAYIHYIQMQTGTLTWFYGNPCYITNLAKTLINNYKVYGNSKQEYITIDGVQYKLPSGYQVYSSVEDTNGVVYTPNNGIIPAKRVADGVFGLYNLSTNIFQTSI